MILAGSRRRTVVAVFGIVTLAACAGRGAPPVGANGERPSPTLAPQVFFEEGKLVFLGVNAALARFSLADPLVPIEIAVANKGLERLTVSPEMITLRDRAGGAWPVASPSDSVGRGLRSSFDRNLMPVPFPEIISLRFSSYTSVPATFASRGGNAAMTRTVELAKSSWILTQIWFPNPGGELKGRVFDVQLDAPELPDPVFVTIRF